MAEARYRLPRTDYRYGVTCPRCAGPKAEQAARCKDCYREDLLNGLAHSVSGPDHPQWTGGRKRKRTGGSSAGPQPQSHPWRARTAAALEVARRRREGL